MPGKPPPPARPPYGELIETAREALNLPQRQAAKLAGVARQTWIDTVRGYKLRNRQWEPIESEPRTVARMAHAVRITPGRLASQGRHPDAAVILAEIRVQSAPADSADRELADVIGNSPELREALTRLLRSRDQPAGDDDAPPGRQAR